MISAILLALAVISFYVLLVLPRRRKRLPPGPFPWPVIGNLLSMDKIPYLTLSKWTKIYGNVFTVKLFYREMVIISDAKLAKEAFNKTDLSGRHSFANIEFYLDGDVKGSSRDSVVTAEGKRWLERRRFVLKHLRGFTKDNLYPLLIKEIGDLVDWGKTQVGKPVVLTPKISTATVNVLWILICGERLIQDEVTEQQFSIASETFFQGFDNPLFMYYPSLAKLFGQWSGWTNLTDKLRTLHKLLRPAVTRRLEKYKDLPVDNPQDFLDNLIKAVKETTDESSSFYSAYDSIDVLVRDVLFAGTETVRTTTQWAILYLCAYPESQRKLQKEIDDKLGRNEQVTIDHLQRLPYAQAVVREALRRSSLTPLGLGHRATEDVEFHGMVIPKDTMVAINAYHMHHDPEVWGDPENFRPDRFLTVNEEGVEVLKNYDEFMPFSVGRRVCVGEQFAKEELFLFLTNLFQNFDIALAPGVTPNLDPRTVGMRSSHVHEVVLTNRS